MDTNSSRKMLSAALFLQTCHFVFANMTVYGADPADIISYSRSQNTRVGQKGLLFSMKSLIQVGVMCVIVKTCCFFLFFL